MKHPPTLGATTSAPLAVRNRVEAIRAGERAAIARAITAIENDLPEGQAIVAALLPGVGQAHVVGITGPPGAGKSTLIDALLRAYAERGRRVAVVAVDPTSPITGGAVLGDRVRMAQGGVPDSVFIRSLASRGHPGGLARAVRDIVDLLDAAGFDTIIVETVGAGQSDVAIATLADTSLVVCPPGLGDDVQAIKAGVLEIADVLVASKGDSPLAERTVRDLADMLALRRADGGWKVPIVRTAAVSGEGVDTLIEAVARHALAAGRGRRLLRDAAAPSASAPDAGAGALARVKRLAGRDTFMRHCGLEVRDAAAGRATVAMTVGPEHLNFNGTCHGGALFALADSAFGLASNSHGAVAAGVDAHISYHVAVREGETIVAQAVEISRNARLAVYGVEVARGCDRVASFTGTVYVTGRRHA